jgi:thioredoxin-like negative regulator of GroEL
MDEIARQIPVRKQNIDYIDPAVLEAANVRNVPTVILVEDGQEIKRFTGVKSNSQIITWLNEG